MKPLPKLRHQHGRAMKQRGVVLFFALIALVVMSLAAVALIRSVDTSTLIAGNLAFKQSATSSGDAGSEAAITWLAATYTANTAISASRDTTHPFNVTNAAAGYYSNIDSTVSLTDGTGIQWTAADSASGGTDGSGNTIRYVIQRMCTTANRLLGAQELPLDIPPKTGCLFSSAVLDKNNRTVPLPQDQCDGDGCPPAGASPIYRVTSRITGPRNTVSYIQAFVY